MFYKIKKSLEMPIFSRFSGYMGIYEVTQGQMKNPKIWCRRPGSNRYGIATTGF